MFETITQGIFPSDVVIRTALLYGLDDIQSNPWLLDYCFSWFANDPLTKDSKGYGRAEIESLKKWFLNTHVAVYMSELPAEPQFPCITITLMSSNQETMGLADIHHDPTEYANPIDVNARPIIILGPFTPKAYNNGVVTLPDNLDTSELVIGLMLYDAAHEIAYSITDLDPDNNTLTIALNSTLPPPNLKDCFVAPAASVYSISLESSLFKEQYRLGIHCPGEPKLALALDAILRFMLLRYKEALLEARGFEISSLTTSDFGKNEFMSDAAMQPTYSRYTVISGTVRNYWPKAVEIPFAAVRMGGTACDVNNISPGFVLFCSGLLQGWAPGPNPLLDGIDPI